MLEIIKAALESPVGSFSFVFGVMAACGWVIHYTTKFATKISVKHDLFNARIDKTESNIDEIRKDVSYLKGQFDSVIGLKEATIKKKSPISLTDIGAEIANSNNIVAMIDDNWSKINETLQSAKTKNPYDLQQFCMEKTFVEPQNFFNDKDIEKLKIIAYNLGMPLLSITQIAGVLIRDRYFTKNGIDLAEVDVYAPN